MRRSAGSLQHFDVTSELGAEAISFDLQVVRGLQVEPEARGVPKKACESECCVSRDSASSVDNFVNASCGDTKALCKAILGES
jgi:hypothetical protein